MCFNVPTPDKVAETIIRILRDRKETVILDSYIKEDLKYRVIVITEPILSLVPSLVVILLVGYPQNQSFVDTLQNRCSSKVTASVPTRSTDLSTRGTCLSTRSICLFICNLRSTIYLSFDDSFQYLWIKNSIYLMGSRDWVAEGQHMGPGAERNKYPNWRPIDLLDE